MVKVGVTDTVTGLQEGARNMIGIAIACGTAGLIVGAITLTGLGLRMTAFVELVSMGNVLIMLFSPRPFAWCWAWACPPPPTTSSWRP